MSENKDTKDTRTATMRIEDLERVTTVLYQNVTQVVTAIQNLQNIQRDTALLKDAMKILNKRIEATIQSATPESGITATAVDALVTKMNVTELTAQVAGYVTNGYLAATDADATAATNSYLVCEEYNVDGTLANPRVQFRVDSLDQATQDALAGKKVGDTASFGENKFSAKILEIYTLVEQKAPEAATADATADATTTAEATTTADATTATTDASTSDAAAETASAPTTTLDALPPESPIVEFVPSDASTMATA